MTKQQQQQKRGCWQHFLQTEWEYRIQLHWLSDCKIPAVVHPHLILLAAFSRSCCLSFSALVLPRRYFCHQSLSLYFYLLAITAVHFTSQQNFKSYVFIKGVDSEIGLKTFGYGYVNLLSSECYDFIVSEYIAWNSIPCQQMQNCT